MTQQRRKRILGAALVVGLMAGGSTPALANHLIPEETGAQTEIGEGEDARGRPSPAPDMPCDDTLADVRADILADVEPEAAPASSRACAGEDGAGVDVAVGDEEPGSEDTDGSGVGRVAVTADADPTVVQIYFEDYTPGNLVANAIWELNDHADCRLLPAHCGEPGVDDHDDDALLFTPLDQSPDDPGNSDGR